MQQLIDPVSLARIKDLPLAAKIIAEGFLQGRHASIQRGTGLEFNQYRSYEPGDPLSKIDWKLFARSDRYFVREAERESNLDLWLLLDASASMAYQPRTNGPSKLEYGRCLLATLAYLAHQQGDAIGCSALSSNRMDYLPALTGQQHWRRALTLLSGVSTGGAFPDPASLRRRFSALRRNSLVLVVSDFYQKNNEILDFIAELKGPHSDVIAIQLASDEEITFPYRGPVRFKDSETGEEVLVSGQGVQSEYLKARARFNQQLSAQLELKQIHRLSVNMSKPLDQILFDFLRHRQRAL